LGTPRRIKVCQVLNTYAVGGAETVALDVARGLDPERFAASALAVLEPRTESEPEMRRRFREAGVEAGALHHRSFRDPRTLWDLYRHFRREKPDIVHGHNRWSDYWACRVAGWAGVPHALWTRHSVYRDMSARQLGRYRAVARRAPLVLAVSDAVHANLLEVEGLPAARLRTVVNGIDTARFRPRNTAARLAVRESLGVAENELMVLQVGRLIPDKAPAAFLALVGRLRAKGLPVRGFLCGDGPLAGDLAVQAQGSSVALLGLRSDVPELLDAGDLVVSTSRVEGLPLNLMEAMATGAAFVGPDLDQIRQLVVAVPELASCLYAQPPREGEIPGALIDRWADHAAALLRDPERRAKLGRAGRRVIEESFSLQRMVQEYASIYESLMSDG
jgi:glycosyltransferase involved in cell wall biosynthesis